MRQSFSRQSKLISSFELVDYSIKVTMRVRVRNNKRTEDNKDIRSLAKNESHL